LLPKYATPLRLRVAILVSVALATAVPDLLYYLIVQPEVLDLHYTGRHLLSPLQTLGSWRVIEQNRWLGFPFGVGVTGLIALIALMTMGVREAEEDASINPYRPAPAAGEPGRADLTY